MAKQTGSYRQIVSIPADLKSRMDKVSQPVNWSAVASVAFEKKLGEIAAAKEKKSMQDVIQRLRGSKLQGESENHKEGKEIGARWARDNAEKVELERLDRWAAHMERDNVWGNNESAFTVADHLYFAIAPDDQSRKASLEFWEWIGATDENQGDEAFAKGFVAGALEVWYAVKDEI